MTVTNPLPISLALLNLALPGAWLAGRALARKAVDDPATRIGLTPGLTVALLLSVVHILGRVCRSFPLGLAIGLTALGILGYCLTLLRRAKEEPAERARPNWPLIASSLVAVALLAPAAFAWSFHDEANYNGHTSIVSQIQNGHYPPHDLSFSGRELRYHYGFDLLAAIVTALTRIGVSESIDVVTLACWGYSWCLLGLIGERIVGSGRGILAAAVTLLGAGLPWLGTAYESPGLLGVLGLGQVGSVSLNPPLVSYAFQHPWSLGQPLALGVFLIHVSKSSDQIGRNLAFFVGIVTLSFTQFVLFATSTASLAAAETVAEWPRRRFRSFLTPLVASGAAAVSTQLGGFFVPTEAGGSGLFLRIGIAPGLESVVRWHLLTFGLLLPLGVLGFRWLRGGRVFLGLLVAGSLGVLNLLEYAHSWDIVKFAAVASLALGIGSAATINRIAAARPRGVAIVLAAILLAATVGAGIAYPALFAVDARGIPAQVFPKRVDQVSSHDAEVISWLRRRVAAGESVYRAQPASSPYALQGGLPVPWFDSMTESAGYSRRRLAARERFLRNLPDSPDEFLDRNIPWLVLAPSDGELNDHVNRWIASGRAKVVWSAGRLRVVHLTRGASR